MKSFKSLIIKAQSYELYVCQQPGVPHNKTKQSIKNFLWITLQTSSATGPRAPVVGTDPA